MVVAAASYFIFKGALFPTKVSATFNPIETNFLNCINEKTLTGIRILESKGGYIKDPTFVPGSQYMPFSSQLDFLGVGIPYWRSVSGNNLLINQVPTKEEMQTQLEDYLNNEISSCNFNSFVSEGFQISKGIPKAKVTINDDTVDVSLNMDLKMLKGKESQTVRGHNVQVNSELGNLFNDAQTFYNLENKDQILENYSVDILRNYAPVDGVELTCAPKVWNADKIFGTLKSATESNFFALRNNKNDTDYFNLRVPIDSSVRVLNSASWPNSYEVAPANSQMLVAKPVGTQKGLGILGFCYVPYHFVYNIRYPVLVQLTRKGETFQFPLPIIIDENFPRGIQSSTEKVNASFQDLDLCNDVAKSNVTINLVNSNGNPVKGNVSYECLGSSCYFGSTTSGVLQTMVPQCANGKIIVDSQGYKEAVQEFSSVSGGSSTIALSKIYPKQISLKLNNAKGNENSIVTFTSQDSFETYTLLYPQNMEVNLTAGTYDVQVYTYDNSSIKFPASTSRQCVQVPSGILGVVGITHEECSSVPVPEQNLTNILVAGGKAKVSFSEEDLAKNNKIQITLDRYNTPSSLNELQVVYTLVDAKSAGVDLI